MYTTIFFVVFGPPLLLFAYLLLRPPRFPNVPGPSLRDYLLRGGLVNELLRDQRKFLYTILALADRYGDVFQFWAGPRHLLFTSVPDDMVQILTSRQDFERPDGVISAFELIAPGSIFTVGPEKHAVARKILRNAFHHSLMKNFHPSMLDAVNELVEDLKKLATSTDTTTTIATHDQQVGDQRQENSRSSPVFDMTEMLSAVTFRVILNVAFGTEMSREQRVEFARKVDLLTKEIMAEIMAYPIRGSLAPFGVRDRLFQTRDFLHKFLGEIAAKRLSESADEKAGRPTDFLDAVIEVEGDDTDAIVSNTVFTAAAGSHTSNIGMTWCLYSLCNHPEVAAKVQAELDAIASASADTHFSYEDMTKMVYLKKVWRETLRLRPATGFTTRKAVRDVTLRGSGVKVPKNSKVGLLFMRCHLDEKYWTQPEKFIPERWGTLEDPGEGDTVRSGVYLPFSAGSRNCVGQNLADYEAILVLATLLHRFKFSLACDPSEVVSTSGVVQAGRYSSKKDGVLDMGIPMCVELR